MTYSLRIIDLPSTERPRERLLAHGVKHLKNAELIAILLGTGQGPGKLSAIGLGEYILNHFGQHQRDPLERLRDVHPQELMNIPEIVRLNYITGNYSMFIEIVCKDITQLRYVLHDALQKIKGIDRTETFISLEEGFNRNVQVSPPEE